MNRFKQLAKRLLARWYAPWAKTITGVTGTVLIFVAGAAFFGGQHEMESVLSRASYDWSFDFTSAIRPAFVNSEVVIVYMDRVDSDSRTNLPLVVRRLTEEGANAIVMDLDLSDSGPTIDVEENLATAIRRHGKVILAADVAYGGYPGAAGSAGDIILPARRLRESAAGVGASVLRKDVDFTVRQHTSSTAGPLPNLAWVAAKALDASVTKESGRAMRWMNYYGSPGTVPDIRFALVKDPATTPTNFFRGKTVLVGHQPVGRDEFRNPYSRWTAGTGFMSATEVHATELLNLLRHDWLSRPPAFLEYGLLLLISAVLGFGLSRLRTLQATIIAGGAALAVTVGVLSLFGNSLVWFPWLVIVAVQIPSGVLWGMLCYSSELYIQRRRLEEERQRAVEQIREQAELLDKAQDAIIVHDLDWRASFWNKSAERLYGWTSNEVLNASLSERILNGEHDKLLDARQSVLRSGEWAGELMQKTKTGSHVLVQSRWSLVRDSAGQPKSILVINTDITESKRLESQFLRAQRMESIGTLAGGIAHDLNNVLSPIVIGVELLQYKLPDDNSQKLLATMSSSAKRGADLVKQVLTFARGHDGERAPLQLTHLLKEMQKILSDTFPKSIQVEVRIEPGLSVVSGDATQLHQVLLNLCVNARDAMHDGGSLILEAENYELGADDTKRVLSARPGSYVRLRVTDTGTGIPPELQERIFEPFFTTKQLGKGTGLGLSTVMSIVKSHGGLVEVHSTPGQGTCFEIILPALNATAVVPAVEQPGEIVTGGSECVLVIDDEVAILEVIRTVLTQNGYRVLVAHHGADAVALCLRTSETIHLVITDMMMPVMDGPRAMRALRELRPELRFIAMSGLQQSEQIREQIGDATFVPKPFSGDRLLRVVREVLSNRGGETRFYRRSFGPGFATELRTRFEPMKA